MEIIDGQEIPNNIQRKCAFCGEVFITSEDGENIRCMMCLDKPLSELKISEGEK